MLQGDGGEPGVTLHTAAGGKVVVCCFEATKEEKQAENLHWFCFLSSCTAIPRSSSCARVPILVGVPAPWGKEEVYSAGNSKSSNETEEESKAKQNNLPSPEMQGVK